jgi:hypothetical protein
MAIVAIGNCIEETMNCLNVHERRSHIDCPAVLGWSFMKTPAFLNSKGFKAYRYSEGKDMNPWNDWLASKLLINHAIQTSYYLSRSCTAEAESLDPGFIRTIRKKVR